MAYSTLKTPTGDVKDGLQLFINQRFTFFVMFMAKSGCVGVSGMITADFFRAEKIAGVEKRCKWLLT